MTGGFGGLDNADWEEDNFNYASEEDVLAEECAKDLFESYAGLHGVQSWEDENPDYTENDINEAYREEMDSWIDYKVEEVK